MSTSNFTKYQIDFLDDTGLDWKTNVDTFIQYCQAKALDIIMQQQSDLLNKIIDELKKMHI